MSRSQAQYRPLPRRPLRRPPVERAADVRRGRGRRRRRRLWRPARRRAPARRPASRTSASSRRAAISAAPGTGTAIPAPPATSRATSTCRCSKRSATCRSREVHARAGDPATTAARIGEHVRPLQATRCSRPRSPRCAGTTASSRWIIATNRGDAMKARFVVHGAAARCTGRSCPASRASRPSRATASTPAAGTTTTRAAIRTAISTRLADKRVGIIGTGATAVQCVPHLGARRQAALRLPAHALVDRRARQQADRPRVGDRR